MAIDRELRRASGSCPTHHWISLGLTHPSWGSRGSASPMCGDIRNCCRTGAPLALCQWQGRRRGRTGACGGMTSSPVHHEVWSIETVDIARRSRMSCSPPGSTSPRREREDLPGGRSGASRRPAPRRGGMDALPGHQAGSRISFVRPTCDPSGASHRNVRRRSRAAAAPTFSRSYRRAMMVSHAKAPGEEEDDHRFRGQQGRPRAEAYVA